MIERILRGYLFVINFFKRIFPSHPQRHRNDKNQWKWQFLVPFLNFYCLSKIKKKKSSKIWDLRPNAPEAEFSRKIGSAFWCIFFFFTFWKPRKNFLDKASRFLVNTRMNFYFFPFSCLYFFFFFIFAFFFPDVIIWERFYYLHLPLPLFWMFATIFWFYLFSQTSFQCQFNGISFFEHSMQVFRRRIIAS